MSQPINTYWCATHHNTGSGEISDLPNRPQMSGYAHCWLRSWAEEGLEADFYAEGECVMVPCSVSVNA